MGFPGQTASLGRSVMELSTDSSTFFSDLDKAEKKALGLGATFTKVGKDLQGYAGSVKSAGQQSAAAGQQMTSSFASVEKGVASLTVSLKTLAKAMIVTEAIQALRAVVGLTGELTDMAAKTGIGTTALQKLKYAAEQSGGSLEQVTKAIGVMGKNLIEGDAGAVGAMRRLGLNLEEIRRQEPGAAFTTIADAIAKIESPMERSTLAMQVFGKSGSELLPMMTGNLKALGEEAEKSGLILSEETVAAGDAFGDSMGKLLTVGMAVIGKVLTPFLPLLTKLAEWASVAAGILGDVLGGALNVVFTVGQKVIDFLGKWIGRFLEVAKTIPGVSSTIEATAQAFDKMKDMAYDAGVSIGAIKPASANAKSGLTGLKSAVFDVGTATRATTKATEDYQKALERAAKVGVETYREYHDAIDRVNTDMGILVRDRLKALGDQARQVLDDATESTARMIDVLAHGLPVTKGIAKNIGDIGEEIAQTFSPAQLTKIQQFGTALSQTIMAAITGGGDKMKSIGGFLGGSLFEIGGESTRLSKSITSWVAKISGTAATALSAILPGLGNLLGAIGGELIGKLFDRSRGRRAVEEFAQSLGGFDAVQARLEKLGEPGKQLWISLTQGVGRNNPQQAAQTIDMVKRKLEELEGAQAAFNTTLQTSLQRVRELGGGIPDALRPYLDELRTAGRLTQENLDLLDELGGGGSISWQMLEEAAGRYGASTDKLGQSFHAMKLHEAWQQIIDDIDLFARGGANVNALLSDMSDEISDLVQDSMKFGTEIPENMRPWIEQLIASGQLLDENGDKITDIGRLTFGETLQTSLQKLTSEIQKLILTLGGVPAAIDAIPNSVDVEVNYHERTYTDTPDESATPAARGGRVVAGGIRRFAGGGVVPDLAGLGRRILTSFAPRGTDTVPAMLTPGELVLNEGQQESLRNLVGSTLRGIAAPLSGMVAGSATAARPASSAAVASSAPRVEKLDVHIHALDGTSVDRVVRSRDFLESMKKVLTGDTHGIRTHVVAITT